MKKPVASFLLIASLACLSFAAAGCASEEAPPAAAPDQAAETGAEDDLTSSANKSCGAAYTPALRKYELAVQAAKKYNAGGSCEEVTHSKDKSLTTTVTQEDIGGLILEAIGECGAFRDVYTKSPYAAPARQALGDSLISKVADGSLDTKSFRGLAKALPGTTLYGPKPGVMLMFTVDFRADGKATFRSYDWDLEKEVSSEATYVVSEGDKPTLTITDAGGTTTTYTPRFDSEGYYSTIVFSGPDENTSPISTSSDPCSALSMCEPGHRSQQRTDAPPQQLAPVAKDPNAHLERRTVTRLAASRAGSVAALPTLARVFSSPLGTTLSLSFFTSLASR